MRGKLFFKLEKKGVGMGRVEGGRVDGRGYTPNRRELWEGCSSGA